MASYYFIVEGREGGGGKTAATLFHLPVSHQTSCPPPGRSLDANHVFVFFVDPPYTYCHYNFNALAPASKSINSSALAALPPQTTVPRSSTANAPPCCHLFPMVVPGPPASSSSSPGGGAAAAAFLAAPFLVGGGATESKLRACPVRWMLVATRAPSQPVSFHAAVCVVGLK